MTMRRITTILAALAAAVTALVAVGAHTPTARAATPVRIMALGDSITGSPGCWRALLWQRLQNNGFTDIDFVGTLPPQGCGFTYDGENEGHGGFLVTNVANQNQLPGWLSATRPDIVLMHFGTNDVWNNIAPTTILAAYGKLVDQMRASNPSMKVLVAQIIPMNPSNCADCGQRVAALNAAIPSWASQKSTPQSPVVVVNQWTGFSTASDTYDGVHPNDAGNQKMSDRWYPALAAQLGGATRPPTSNPPTSGPPTSNPPTSNPPTSNPPTSNPPGNGGCSASYRITGQWQGAFQGEVSVRNAGTAPISAWTVRFSFANGQQVSQAWSAELSQSGAAVTARNMPWNGTIAPGTSTAFGFIASWTGTNSVPTPTCTVTT